MDNELPEDCLVCNCAQCGNLLIGENQSRRELPQDAPPTVGGRIHGRPYCRGCLTVRPIPDYVRDGDGEPTLLEMLISAMEC